MKKIRINFKKEDTRKILLRVLRYKRLFVLIFFGSLVIYTFNTIYQYAYLNPNEVEFIQTETYIIKDGVIKNRNLEKVLNEIESRNLRIKNKENEVHKNPFIFEHSPESVKSEEITSENSEE